MDGRSGREQRQYVNEAVMCDAWIRYQQAAQVISAILPTALAEALLSEAERRALRPSDLIRQAVDAFLHAQTGGVAGISANSSGAMRVAVLFMDHCRTENRNPVVEPTDLHGMSVGAAVYLVGVARPC